MLFLYAIAFSLAYLSLSAGTGALLLFGSVQATMLLVALRAGERPHPWTWVGLGVALAGLCVLVAPGLRAPSPGGAALMIAAGIAWGVYSLRGRGAPDPLAATTDNFVRSVPLVVAAGLAAWAVHGPHHVSPRGVLLALISGAVTSGVGYVVWYAALRGLTATRAATVQLAVPVLAAVAGVVLLSEAVTVRLVASAALILGGIAVALFDPSKSGGLSQQEP
jgi:drug/metabolite transporter (DMT)-like permease